MGIYEDYLIYKDNKINQYFVKIIQELDPIIYGSIKEIKGTKRDDLYQEILMKVHEKMMTEIFIVKDVRTITESLYQGIPDNRILKFVQKNGQEKLMNRSTKSTEEFEKFEERFKQSYGETNIKNYVKKVSITKKKDFMRRERRESLILNRKVGDELEILDLIPARQDPLFEQRSSFDLLDSISPEEKQFLRSFLERDRILTQKEVGEKCNKTQQAISIKLKKIHEKIKRGKF